MSHEAKIHLFRDPVFVWSDPRLCAPGPAAASADRPIHCRLDVSVDPKASKVSGVMEISAEAGRELTLYPNKARILELRNGVVKTDVGQLVNKDEIVLRATGPVRLRYETTVKDPEDNLLTDQDIVLKYAWYPSWKATALTRSGPSCPAGLLPFPKGRAWRTPDRGTRRFWSPV